MNIENYHRFAKQYDRAEVGSTANKYKVKRGYVVWAENGIWITAKKVISGHGHAYDNGGYELGIRDCPCGCYMLSSSCGGPVDPFGKCPLGGECTMTKAQRLQITAAKSTSFGSVHVTPEQAVSIADELDLLTTLHATDLERIKQFVEAELAYHTQIDALIDERDRLKTVLRDAQMYIEAYHIDWARFHSGPDNDPEYQPVFPEIVERCAAALKGETIK